MIDDLSAVPLWRLDVVVEPHQVAIAELIFEGVSNAVSSYVGHDGGPWRVEGYTDTPPDLAAVQKGLELAIGLAPEDVPKVSVEFLSPRDWLAENLSSFQPIRIERFFIYPSHYDGAFPIASIPFEIDAGTAFGSGTHPTTSTCLRALTKLAKVKRVSKALDLGCGSGLLACAMAKLWPADIVAVDIDPEAVRVTKENARINQLPHRITTLLSNGLQHPILADRSPFDLIVANVLARPLIGMARDISRALAPGASLVLSGLLIRDAQWVTSRYKAYGLVFEREMRDGEWATLTLRKPG